MGERKNGDGDFVGSGSFPFLSSPVASSFCFVLIFFIFVLVMVIEEYWLRMVVVDL
jgi:hypothetical protein